MKRPLFSQAQSKQTSVRARAGGSWLGSSAQPWSWSVCDELGLRWLRLWGMGEGVGEKKHSLMFPSLILLDAPLEEEAIWGMQPESWKRQMQGREASTHQSICCPRVSSFCFQPVVNLQLSVSPWLLCPRISPIQIHISALSTLGVSLSISWSSPSFPCLHLC